MTSSDRLLEEQIAYYQARAGEYDEWFLRQGRYDHGPEMNARWFAEAEQVAQALEAFAPVGDVLELASGTGLWTQRLAPTARSVTAVDSSPEVHAINQERLGGVPTLVRYVVADLFRWQPDRQYDTIFFSFWLSHVPPERLESFWSIVRAALAPGGRVFFVDALYEETSTAKNHQLEGPDAHAVTRRLNDGQEYRIVKVFYRPETLTEQLTAWGWRARIERTPTYFYYGEATIA
ncbi:MAG TPA: class I SAM-dependent methyltransferase [Ktedonobacterales bacterium]|jgi:demethylmenaquinone methyltransferase/2-methoxy-6-polyprenyl-1,4-benzoquinol methylase